MKSFAASAVLGGPASCWSGGEVGLVKTGRPEVVMVAPRVATILEQKHPYIWRLKYSLGSSCIRVLLTTASPSTSSRGLAGEGNPADAAFDRDDLQLGNRWQSRRSGSRGLALSM